MYIDKERLYIIGQHGLEGWSNLMAYLYKLIESVADHNLAIIPDSPELPVKSSPQKLRRILEDNIELILS